MEVAASARLFSRSERSQTATAREALGVIASSTLYASLSEMFRGVVQVWPWSVDRLTWMRVNSAS